ASVSRRVFRQRGRHDAASVACVKSKMPLRLVTLMLSILSLSILHAQEEPLNEKKYEREELGVNEYTAPPIAEVFAELDKLRPLPFDQLWRELPPAQSRKREDK